MSEAGLGASSRPYASLVALSLCAALTTGCGTKQEPDETGTLGAIKRALCENLIRCGLGTYERVEDCTGEPDRSCVVEDLDQPLDGAAACARGLHALSCSDHLLGLPAACEGPVASLGKLDGNPDLDEGCASATSCLYGLYCSGEGDAPACGVCLRLPRAGEPCTTRALCAAGLFCNDARTCEARRENGASCAQAGECREGTCVSTKCVPPVVLREGEACLSGGHCAPSTVCAEGLCRALVSTGEPCVPRQCFRGRTCVEGRCAELLGCGMGHDGDGCNIDAHCGAGLVCDALVERCRPTRIRKQELGAACTESTDCFTDYCFENKCTDPGPVCAALAAGKQP